MIVLGFLDIFSYFSINKHKQYCGYSLEALVTICIKYQNLFSGKNKKNIIICHLLN